MSSSDGGKIFLKTNLPSIVPPSSSRPQQTAEPLRADDFSSPKTVPQPKEDIKLQRPKGTTQIHMPLRALKLPVWAQAFEKPHARTLLIVPEEKSQEAIALEVAKNSKRSFVYLSSPQNLFRQKADILNALKNGGNIVINLAAFTEAQHLVQLNGLLEVPPEWGKFKATSADVRIVGLLPQQHIAAKRLSADFISRFKSASALNVESLQTLPEAKPIAVEKYQALKDNEYLIDLRGSNQWRTLLTQGWQKALDNGKNIIIRNPPENSELQLQLQLLQILLPASAKIQQGYDDKRAALKKAVPHDAKKPVLIVNQANFDNIFCLSSGNDKNGVLTPQPPLLDTLTELPVIRLSDDLTLHQVHAILDHKKTFALELTNLQVEIFKDFKPQAEQIAIDSKHVKIKSQTDADLTLADLDEKSPVVIDVTSKAVCITDLIEQIVPHEKDPDKYTLQPGLLVNALEKGDCVVLRGLHLRPDLKKQLAGLFCETPYLVINNKIVFLEQFKKPIIILETGTETSLSVTKALARNFTDGDEKIIDTDLKKIDELFTVFKEQGVSPQILQKNFRHIQALFDCVYKDSKSFKKSFEKQPSVLVQALLGGIEDPLLQQTLLTEIAKIFDCKPSKPQVGSVENCVQLLQQTRALFLIGTPGSGKSFAASETARNLGKGKVFNPGSIGSRHGDDFLKALVEWAEASTEERYAVLTIDEANLAEENFWELFSTVFNDPPTLTVLGQTFPLTEKHKIIFTGNSYHLEGRNRQKIIDECFVTLPFLPMTSAELDAKILTPLTKDLKLSPELNKDLLTFHSFFEKHFPNEPATVRCLKNVLIRTALSEKSDRTTLLQNAFEIYTGALPLAQQKVIQFWIENQFNLKLPEPQKQTVKDAKDFHWVESAKQLVGTVERELLFREQRMDEKTPKAVLAAHRALIIEGPPGRGKDAVVDAVLKTRHLKKSEDAKDEKHYCKVTAGMAWSDLKKLIQQAQKTGAVIVVSELNLLPANILEGEFNDLLTDEQAAPGFMLIGTINPPEYAGRERLSQAFRNRVRYVSVPEYTEQEQTEILRAQKVKEQDIRQIIDYHQNVIAQQRARGAEAILPTARQLLAVAAEYPLKRQLKDVLTEVYGFYHLTAGTEKPRREPTLQQKQALELTKLLWPESPFNSVEFLEKTSELPPRILPNTLLLKEPFNLNQVIAAIAVARFRQHATGTSPKEKADDCCAKLTAQTKFICNAATKKWTEIIFTEKNTKPTLSEQLKHKLTQVTPEKPTEEITDIKKTKWSTKKKIGAGFVITFGVPLGLALAIPVATVGGIIYAGSVARKKLRTRKIQTKLSGMNQTTAGKSTAVSSAPSPIKRKIKPGTGLYQSSQKSNYGTWQSHSQPPFYFASGYFSPKTSKLLDDGEREAIQKQTKKSKPSHPPTVSISVNNSQLSSGFPEMPRLTGHAVWIEAETNKRQIKQWEPVTLSPDEQLKCLKYSLYPTKYPHKTPKVEQGEYPKDTRIKLKYFTKEWQRILEIIDDSKTDKITQLKAIAQFIQSNTIYCDTPEMIKMAAEAYNGKIPSVKEFMKKKYGACAEGNMLLAAIASQILNLPTRRVSGWQGEINGKISATPHAWVEVFYENQWHVLDATPKVFAARTKMPSNYRTPAVSRTVAESVAAITKLPYFTRAALNLAAMPSDKPSRHTKNATYTSSGEAYFETLELDVSAQKIPIILSHHADLFSFIDRMILGDEVLQALLNHGFKISVRDANGDIRPVSNTKEIMEWGYALPEHMPPPKIANSNALVTTVEDLIDDLRTIIAPKHLTPEYLPYTLISISPSEFRALLRTGQLQPQELVTLLFMSSRPELIEIFTKMGFAKTIKDEFGYTLHDYEAWRHKKGALDWYRANGKKSNLLQRVFAPGGVEESICERFIEDAKKPQNPLYLIFLTSILSQRYSSIVITLLRRWNLQPDDLQPLPKIGTFPMCFVQFMGRTQPEPTAQLLLDWALQPKDLQIINKQGKTLPMIVVSCLGESSAEITANLLDKWKITKECLQQKNEHGKTLIDLLRESSQSEVYQPLIKKFEKILAEEK